MGPLTTERLHHPPSWPCARHPHAGISPAAAVAAAANAACFWARPSFSWDWWASTSSAAASPKRQLPNAPACRPTAVQDEASRLGKWFAWQGCSRVSRVSGHSISVMWLFEVTKKVACQQKHAAMHKAPGEHCPGCLRSVNGSSCALLSLQVGSTLARKFKRKINCRYQLWAAVVHKHNKNLSNARVTQTAG